jgi:hypothetical protein
MEKTLHKTLMLILLATAPFLPAGAEAGSLKITEMAVTTKIVKGNPIDSVHRISSASIKQLYCFTRLISAEEGETTVKHVWYKGAEKVGESDLPVKGKMWRTFSSRAVEKGMADDWRVDALDSDGKLLKSVKFRMN